MASSYNPRSSEQNATKQIILPTLMGRRAVYLTQAERSSSAQQRKKASAETAHGQLLRKAQNHRAYEIRKALAPPKPPKVTLPVFSTLSLSAELVSLAEFPTPESYHFRQAVRSSDAFNDTDYSDSELAKWDCPPPYLHPYPAPHRPDRLADALHGYRLRTQQEEEDSRLRRYEIEQLTTFAMGVHAELMRRHDHWKKLRKAMSGISEESIDGHLGMGLLRWEARVKHWLGSRAANVVKRRSPYRVLKIENSDISGFRLDTGHLLCSKRVRTGQKQDLF
ncbi:hypothetical protein FPV67DRAFT_1448950 [Lyophyllum atratum]|nr:hypothetical protein FPV67DRAFT_1448950 [Lyophyllum atratum]